MLFWSALSFWCFWSSYSIAAVCRAGRYFLGCLLLLSNLLKEQMPVHRGLLMPLGEEERDTGLHCCQHHQQIRPSTSLGCGFGGSLLGLCRTSPVPVLQRMKERAFLGFFCLFLPASHVPSLGYVGTLHVVIPQILRSSASPAFRVHLLLFVEQFPGCLVIFSGEN